MAEDKRMAVCDEAEEMFVPDDVVEVALPVGEALLMLGALDEYRKILAHAYGDEESIPVGEHLDAGIDKLRAALGEDA